MLAHIEKDYLLYVTYYISLLEKGGKRQEPKECPSLFNLVLTILPKEKWQGWRRRWKGPAKNLPFCKGS